MFYCLSMHIQWLHVRNEDIYTRKCQCTMRPKAKLHITLMLYITFLFLSTENSLPNVTNSSRYLYLKYLWAYHSINPNLSYLQNNISKLSGGPSEATYNYLRVVSLPLFVTGFPHGANKFFVIVIIVTVIIVIIVIVIIVIVIIGLIRHLEQPSALEFRFEVYEFGCNAIIVLFLTLPTAY